MNPAFAVAADLNPGTGDGSNSLTHEDRGQNVLYADGHLTWETTPLCGVNGDNIYANKNGARHRLAGGRDRQPAAAGPALILEELLPRTRSRPFPTEAPDSRVSRPAKEPVTRSALPDPSEAERGGARRSEAERGGASARPEIGSVSSPA